MYRKCLSHSGISLTHLPDPYPHSKLSLSQRLPKHLGHHHWDLQNHILSFLQNFVLTKKDEHLILYTFQNCLTKSQHQSHYHHFQSQPSQSYWTTNYLYHSKIRYHFLCRSLSPCFCNFGIDEFCILCFHFNHT